MAVSEIRFDIELDPYKSFVDKRIEDLGEKWQQLAKDILEETSDKRTEGVKKLKVILIFHRFVKFVFSVFCTN